MSRFKVGQLVWVPTAMKGQDEVGTVIKLNCSRNMAAESDDENASGLIVQDGVMVALKVGIGKSKGIYDPLQLRPYSDSKRASRRTTAPSSNSIMESAVKAPRASNNQILAVTPSPLQAATSIDFQDKKPAAKRKSLDRTAASTTRQSLKKKVALNSISLGSTGLPFGSRLEERDLESGDEYEREDEEEEDDDTDDSMVSDALQAQLVKPKSKVIKTKPSTTAKVDKATNPKVGKHTVATKRKVIDIASSGSDEDYNGKVESEPEAASSRAGDEEDGDDGGEDQPFFVDYAPTGRATCRRCDEVIAKGTCRISHVPLFRGKPGFRIYRHLECAQFSEEIHCAQDVGGWRDLDMHDFETLALQVEASKIELEEENRQISPDELVQVAFAGETRKAPAGLAATLLPFQIEGLSWMYHQEVKCEGVKGGVLADEMGMGKTIQTIATMLDNRPLLQHCKPAMKHPPGAADFADRLREDKLWATAVEEWNHEMVMNNVTKKRHPNKHAMTRAGTLVVCPVIALSQWKSEIEKFTEPGTFKVGIYHGPNRAAEMPLDMICKYDIILTTYQVIESDFRKMLSPNKVACPNCGARFKIDKLRVHLKYFCGEGARRTEAQSRQRRGESRRNGEHVNGISRPKIGNRSSKYKKKQKQFSKKVFVEGKNKSAEQARVRVAAQGEYASDSELSAIVSDSKNLKRHARSAATNATERMKALATDNGTGVRSDSDSVFEDEYGDNSSSDNQSIGGESVVRCRIKHMEGIEGRRSKSFKRETCGSDCSNDYMPAVDESVGEAVRRQQKEMEKFVIKRKESKSFTKAHTKVSGKKFGDEDPSTSEDLGEDQLADVNMDALLNEAMAGATFSPLHAFIWWRVVLDEAHYIKSRSSQTAAAAFAMTSVHRWALSGTPLQNRVGELYSLIRFLRLDPMAHYFCRQKGCSCKSLHYRIKSGQCQDCGHRAFTHYAHFNRYVLNPIQREGYTGDGRRAMFKLKEQVLDKCLLRRTKETKAADLNLPPRIVKIRAVRLHPIEQDFYDALYTQTKSSFDDYVASGTVLNNFAHIFDMLTRLRQGVNHPYLIVYSHRAMKKLREAGQLPVVANGSVECAICDEPFTERVTSSCCGAGFCRACVIEYVSAAGDGSANCPGCERPFSIDLNQQSSDSTDDGTLIAPTKSSSSDPTLKELSHVATGSILRRINLAEFATSSKIEVLVQELVDMRHKRPGSKALVFSQFVNMLDLVRWRLHSDPCLQDLGLGVRILHGGMDIKSRDQALAEFRENDECRVLLMSLKAAGVALNLTVASECYLMDLWWNAAGEEQAIDRLHRLGQFRPIRALRLVAEGTVEERVLQLQEKKRLVFDGTVGRDAASLKMLTVNDMVNLFSHG
ncbi:hypothetical protein MPSEU_000369900 [Mayamaea pseudoterrestris]|nr:hypothetical protein MPSEU_000369900 [Mayamaea pseudoterrestris]